MRKRRRRARRESGAGTGTDSDRRALIGVLENAIARLRAGELPDVPGYVHRHPHLRRKIQSQMELLLRLERRSGSWPRPAVAGPSAFRAGRP